MGLSLRRVSLIWCTWLCKLAWCLLTVRRPSQAIFSPNDAHQMTDYSWWQALWFEGILCLPENINRSSCRKSGASWIRPYNFFPLHCSGIQVLSFLQSYLSSRLELFYKTIPNGSISVQCRFVKLITYLFFLLLLKAVKGQNVISCFKYCLTHILAHIGALFTWTINHCLRLYIFLTLFG